MGKSEWRGYGYVQPLSRSDLSSTSTPQSKWSPGELLSLAVVVAIVVVLAASLLPLMINALFGKNEGVLNTVETICPQHSDGGYGMIKLVSDRGNHYLVTGAQLKQLHLPAHVEIRAKQIGSSTPVAFRLKQLSPTGIDRQQCRAAE